jgi:GTPase SAR1 family protein
VYYKDASAAIVVFDLSRQATLESVLKWKSDIDEKVRLKNGASIPTILLANKAVHVPDQ